MRRKVKFIPGCFLGVVVFIFAFIAYEITRSQFGGPMTIDGLPISNATVTGAWKPDLLWGRKAWWITIQSDEVLELKLDGQRYVVPKGSHTIHANHDYTNTGQFGTEEFSGYPEKVEIRPLERTP